MLTCLPRIIFAENYHEHEKKEMSVLINGLIAFANGTGERTIFSSSSSSLLSLLVTRRGKLPPPLSLSPLFGINRTHKSLSRPTEEPATPTLLLPFFLLFPSQPPNPEQMYCLDEGSKKRKCFLTYKKDTFLEFIF